MGFQINTNVSAMAAYRNLSNTQNSLTGSLEKLSSGLRINKAADDAAGLSISEGLRAQIGGLNVASRNAQDGISVVQTTEGALGEVHSNLQRLRDLAVQAGNDSNNADSRTAIETEAKALVEEIGRISTNTKFNGISLLDNNNTLSFQVGAGADSSNQISVSLASANLSDMVALEAGTPAVADDPDTADVDESADAVAASVTGTLRVVGEADDYEITAGNGLAFNSAANAQLSISTIDDAIKTVSSARSELGASQNRFETAINSIGIQKENLSASESRIRDTDMAAEMANFTRSNILQQAGTSMLAQANSLPQSVLSLLG